MNKELRKGIFNIVFGLLLVVSGLLTIDVGMLPTRLGEAKIFLSREASWFVGGITLFCSIIPLYFGLHAVFKSRRP